MTETILIDPQPEPYTFRLRMEQPGGEGMFLRGTSFVSAKIDASRYLTKEAAFEAFRRACAFNPMVNCRAEVAQ